MRAVGVTNCHVLSVRIRSYPSVSELVTVLKWRTISDVK